ncbi:beta strand repeat-containing protein, partial [Helicobacter anatolicus]|uniref:beta strand repeat-containing protein n=1 Tax=Helicobacter anatolicus TaxID=2905874 RepID=UPI001E314DB4
MKTKQNKKLKFFTPIVASSLALILGSGSAYADTCTSSSGTPILCAGTKDNETKVDKILAWNGGQTKPPIKTYMPVLHDGGSQPIESLTFKFMDSGNSIQKENSSTAEKAVLTVGNDTNSVLIKGNQKGIQMNTNGQGNLIVDYNNQTGKNFTLDLQDAPDGATSFAGHLKITNQKAGGSGQENTFSATLNYDLKGSVTLSGASGNNTIKFNHGSLRGNIGSGWVANGSENKLTIDFTGNKEGRIEGDIYTRKDDQNNMTITIKDGGLKGNIRNANGENGGEQTGDLIVNFEDGAVMEGNIGHSTTSEANDFQKKQVTFKAQTSNTPASKNSEDNFVLTGNITSYGTGPGWSAELHTENGNHVTFEHGSMKGNISSGYDTRTREGYNKVTFQGENAKLVGSISLINGGQNEIHFEKGGEITGLIYTNTDSYGKSFGNREKRIYNRITFDGTQNASIISSNNNENVISSSGRANYIIFNGTGTNTITGNIFARNFYFGTGNNTITFNGNGTNTITGNITAGSGSNVIIFNSNGNNTITGNIITNSGSNIIVFAPKTSNMTASDSSPESKSSNSNTINGTIQANGGSANKIISINATNGGDNASNSTGITNIIKDITAENGTNYITLGIDGAIAETTVKKDGEAQAPTASTSIESTNNITGNILAGRNGNPSVNHIYLKGKNTIGADADGAMMQNSTLSITAHNRDNDNTDKINYIKLEGTSTTINLNEIRAEGKNNNGGNRAKNFISLDGENNTITLTNITGSKGINYIGKNILTTNTPSDITLINDGTNIKKIKDVYTLQQNQNYKFLDPSNRANGKLTITNQRWANVISASNTSAQNHIDFQEMDITGKIDANAGQNYINAEKLSLDGDIIARWGGKNYILVGKSTEMGTLGKQADTTPTITLKNTAIKAESGNSTSENVILFKDNVKFENVSIIGNNNSTNGRKNNFISVDGANNDLVIDNITLNTSGKNYLVKGLVEYTPNTNGGNGFVKINELDMTSDTNAITGKLYIKNGVSTAKDGENFISYKADATILATASMPEVDEEKKEEVVAIAAADATAPQNYIIGKLKEEGGAKVLGTAISGNNNLYLDLSQNTDFADAASVLKKLQGLISNPSANQGFSLQESFQSVIAGHIDNNFDKNNSGGTNNIFIKGGKNAMQPTVMLEGAEGAEGAAGEATTGVKLGLAGNITTNGGSNNIIFEDSIWLPSAIIAPSKEGENNTTQIPFSGTQSGNLINDNGKTNIVLRENGASALSAAGTSIFNVTAKKQAETNIVVQGQVNVGANVDYDNSSTTNFIFANGNNISAMKEAEEGEGNGGKDSFANGSTDVSNTNSKVLGVTYQDGIKLTLKDRMITNSNGENISFLNTYKNYFISKETDPILTLTTNRTSNNFKDTIVIEGLFVGDVVALERSRDNKEKHAEFDVTLKT